MHVENFSCYFIYVFRTFASSTIAGEETFTTNISNHNTQVVLNIPFSFQFPYFPFHPFLPPLRILIYSSTYPTFDFLYIFLQNYLTESFFFANCSKRKHVHCTLFSMSNIILIFVPYIRHSCISYYQRKLSSCMYNTASDPFFFQIFGENVIKYF